ncbi:MAG: V-type ATP synthase subunit B [Sulfolobales archaeon]|nr:V-type ATP synthase subunit B [Sulfolobales archaeon]MCX8185640.1 V-type ATP synthase subunit B [Sulfolobales archaeon]MDW7969583.1 V-type ATP synthase subunit B [Sulfolobales archaeon]
MNYTLSIKELRSVLSAKGSLLFIKSIPGVRYSEIVEVVLESGESRLGQVIDVSRDATVIQVFGGVSEVNVKTSKVRFKGESLRIPVSSDMFGRVMDGLGRPIDGGPNIIPEDFLDINGVPINPASRLPPSEFIETGVSSIDGLLSIVRGQKLPIFSGSGLPHNRIATQIVRQARVRGSEERFAVVFAAIGVTYEDAYYFMNSLRTASTIENVVSIINTASAPTIERIATPRVALTVAEFLAWRYDTHVLVLMVDITNYCEALRELSAAREEVPGRRGYPGYMYTDLATIYERAGRINGKKGSITQMPILTMPDDDITHPIPDLTGYITEGQIVLSRDLFRKGVYPPVDVLLSLSRLMKDGIGTGKTREDHYQVFMQLVSAYAEGQYLRELTAIVGSESLSDRDRKYLNFADLFERRFINQGEFERRSIEETLNVGWDLLATLPEDELKLIGVDYIRKYHPKYRS